MVKNRYSALYPVKIHVAFFDLRVTEITHDLKVIELSEHFRHTVLLKE